ncbi:MAG: metal ABC transporter permease [Rhabdochlamydiaceae bacterium]|nr:metal ABC transporter permease [Candidatus Amphrikana amoebophyrae]
MNPYWGQNFVSFLAIFFKRFFGVITGNLPLAPDELQIFTLSLIGVSTAIIGVFLVLRKSTMQANSLSHTTLLGITLVVIFYGFFTTNETGQFFHFSLTKLILSALITAFATLFFTRFLQEKMRVQTDASIGLVFSLFFALGILLVTLYTRNMHIGVEAIMGNVDALHPNDLFLSLAICFINVAVTIVLYSWYKMTTFDLNLAKSFGIKVGLIETILILQTTLTIMGGFRAVGVILILAMITAPVITARLFTNRLYSLFFFSIAISVLASFFSVALSRHILSVTKVASSTSALNILFLLLFFIISATLTFVLSKRKVATL